MEASIQEVGPLAPWDDPVRLGGTFADMKEIDYRNTLAVASLIELLLEKGVLVRDELAAKVRALDCLAEREARMLSRQRVALGRAPGGPGRRRGFPRPGGTPTAEFDPP